MTDDDFTDKYDRYAEQFDPSYAGARQRAPRKRKPAGGGNPRPPSEPTASEAMELKGPEGDFITTYQPARYEAIWLQASLQTFYEEEQITDVLAQVKGGKEATVYRCAAHPSTGETLLAAKVYRPRMFRNLRNDKLYRAGRAILNADGQEVKKTDHRIMRAIGKKTAFGAQVQHTSWLMYEYTTIDRLHRAGAAVPQPIAVGENAILMSYYGDERRAAPTLNEISLTRAEAAPLFQEVLRNIELMLVHDLIHGDLSAYNMLYWEGRIVIIDFPQVTNARSNDNARFILERDITRVCDYFARQGVERNPDTIMQRLWARYADLEAERLLALQEAEAERQQALQEAKEL